MTASGLLLSLRHVPRAMLLVCTTASTVFAQFPPQRATNLEVLSADMPMRALIDTMASFTRALGVRCTYCHVGEESQPLSAYDFASDVKPAKLKARAMLRMVGEINGRHLPSLVDRRSPAVSVSCATCHRGVTEPRPLQEILLRAYDTGGVDSAEARYIDLRRRYYGSGAYDFSEVSLADVATSVRRRDRLADAVRLYLFNTRQVPTSGFALRQAADAQAAAGDTTGAIASLQKALGINASDQQAIRMLSGLRRR